MKLFGREFHGYAEALVILVGILLAASGLCGFQFLLSNEFPSLGGVLLVTGVLELLAMLLSGLSIVITLVIWLIMAGDKGLTKLFKEENRGE